MTLIVKTPPLGRCSRQNGIFIGSPPRSRVMRSLRFPHARTRLSAEVDEGIALSVAAVPDDALANQRARRHLAGATTRGSSAGQCLRIPPERAKADAKGLAVPRTD